VSEDLRFKPYRAHDGYYVDRPRRRSAPDRDTLFAIWKDDLRDLECRLNRRVGFDDLMICDPRFAPRVELNRWVCEHPRGDDDESLPALYSRWQTIVSLCELQEGRTLTADELKTVIPVRER